MEARWRSIAVPPLCVVAKPIPKVTPSIPDFSLHAQPGTVQAVENRADLYKTEQNQCWSGSHTCWTSPSLGTHVTGRLRKQQGSTKAGRGYGDRPLNAAGAPPSQRGRQ